MSANCLPEDLKVNNPDEKAATHQPLEGDLNPEELQQEIRKYLRYLPQVAEPNLARVREIQEQIRQGTYLTQEMIEETASRLALRFLRKE